MEINSEIEKNRCNSNGNGNENSDDPIPALVSVRSILCGDVNHARLNEVQQYFMEQFDEKPDFFVTVPGRVNLIGEHVDYAGFPVMPIAIEHSVVLAVRLTRKNSLLHLRNMDTGTYFPFRMDLAKLSNADVGGSPDWYKYFLCGILGVREALKGHIENIGMWVALSGNIPSAAGLSSSSALVCAAVLSYAFAQGMQLVSTRLAEIAAKCERFIGTEGGGMDQAIAFLAQAGHAQYIEFQPQLKATSITLPQNTHFVVANTLNCKNKAASPEFNQRVLECCLGAKLLAKGMLIERWQSVINYKDLLDKTSSTLYSLDQLIDKHLGDSYTLAQLAQHFNIEPEKFQRDYLLKTVPNISEFKLKSRGHHVIRESIRVQEFRSICEVPPTDTDTLEEVPIQRRRECLGRLMRESHASLKDLYDCSHENIDRLVQLSDEFGVKARLTGAGWGGCIVAICHSRREALDYIAFLKDRYYKHLPSILQKKYEADNFDSAIFMTKPCKASEVLLNINSP